MSFKFACPHCGQRISAADEDAGTFGGCPNCERQFRVPNRALATPTFLTPRLPVKAPPWQDMKPAIQKETAPEPRNGLSFSALILSIFPGLNVVGLLLAIVAVLRADRGGHYGERGLAIGALVVCGVLILPVNIGGYLAAGPLLHIRMPGMVEFKPVTETPDFTASPELPKLTLPPRKPIVAVGPKAVSKIIEPQQTPGATPDLRHTSDNPGDDSQKALASPSGSTEEAR